MPDVLITGSAVQDQIVLGSAEVPKFVGSISVQIEGSPFSVKQGSIGKDFVAGVHDENGLFPAQCFTSASLVIRKPTQRQDQARSYPLELDERTSDPLSFNLRRVWQPEDFSGLEPGLYQGEIDVTMGGKLTTAPDSDNFEFTVVESLNVP